LTFFFLRETKFICKELQKQKQGKSKNLWVNHIHVRTRRHQLVVLG